MTLAVHFTVHCLRKNNFRQKLRTQLWGIIFSQSSSINVSLASLFCMMYIVQQTVIKLIVQWKEREPGNPLGLRWRRTAFLMSCVAHLSVDATFSLANAEL